MFTTFFKRFLKNRNTLKIKNLKQIDQNFIFIVVKLVIFNCFFLLQPQNKKVILHEKSVFEKN